MYPDQKQPLHALREAQAGGAGDGGRRVNALPVVTVGVTGTRHSWCTLPAKRRRQYHEQPATPTPALFDRTGVTDAVRTQILATEHWSLLATRSMTWNEVFSRASMFVTVVSAGVVALALVAQATAFGPSFRIFALIVLPIVLLVGVGTMIRLNHANTDDLGMVVGMNRLRHAYLELAPELEPYFVTRTMTTRQVLCASMARMKPSASAAFSPETPTLVGAINVVVVGCSPPSLPIRSERRMWLMSRSESSAHCR